MITLFRTALLLAVTGTAACNSGGTVEQAGAPTTFAEEQSLDDSESTAARQVEAPDTLPPTATTLPVLLSIATVALGGALLLSLVQRR